MNPAYQGQLDVFCAAYAVINAMRHINATRLLTCRAILHEALPAMRNRSVPFSSSGQTMWTGWTPCCRAWRNRVRC